MLEVGASLALKPTGHIVLVTQGSASELHFDIKGNVIIEHYRWRRALQQINGQWWRPLETSRHVRRTT